ncbi:MAG TPA: THUMP domain-containing protein [Myxococcota bacterium]|nr:THUMP domain-containing protein [Myxococcota bacterium]HOH77407.1 THUMP domain-containing protein [Myxococcota bacterium]
MVVRHRPAAASKAVQPVEKSPFTRIVTGHDGGMDDHVFFATAASGTEPCLRDELRAMRLRGVRCDRGGVHFSGSWEAAWRACMHSRVALRVLVELGGFEVTDGQSLYDAARTIDWRAYLRPELTLAVSAVCRDSELTHTNFIAQKIKDAIVDRIRDEVGTRPNVDRHDPDVAIFAHLVRNVLTLYLDMSGESLHKRGWRADHLEAPLKENLAAAMLMLSGWDRRTPLHDPMCGSGTIPIEAALWASNIAPGLSRERLGFERWANFDGQMAARMAEIRQEARDMIVTKALPFITGSDIDQRAVEMAAANAMKAGVKVEFARCDVRDMMPLVSPGFVMVNPPYDVRLESNREFYQAMWRRFEALSGHVVCVLAGDPEVDYPSRIKPSRYQYLYNGDIKCRFGVFEIPARPRGR